MGRLKKRTSISLASYEGSLLGSLCWWCWTQLSNRRARCMPERPKHDCAVSCSDRDRDRWWILHHQFLFSTIRHPPVANSSYVVQWCKPGRDCHQCACNTYELAASISCCCANCRHPTRDSSLGCVLIWTKRARRTKSRLSLSQSFYEKIFDFGQKLKV